MTKVIFIDTEGNEYLYNLKIIPHLTETVFLSQFPDEQFIVGQIIHDYAGDTLKIFLIK